MKSKQVLAFLAVLVATAGISFLVYRVAGRLPHTTVSGGSAHSATLPSTDAGAHTGVAGAGTLALTKAASMPPSARQTVSGTNPYAVVRGGICVPSNAPDQEKASRQKWEALLRDPFWQSIFSGVNPQEFSLVKTSFPLDRYVAYWKMNEGELIHWTGKKLLIPAGTRVFTDRRGHMYLCACGNQVAAVLPANLSATVLAPEQEPPMAYLVPPEPEPFSVLPKGLPAETPVAPIEIATSAPYDGPEPILPPVFVPWGGEPGPKPPPGPPPQPPSGPPPQPPPGPPPQPPPGPPPTPEVPEPGTLSLILIGLGASILAHHLGKQQ